MAFLEKAIEGAPLGDPSDEEMAEIVTPSIDSGREEKACASFLMPTWSLPAWAGAVKRTIVCWRWPNGKSRFCHAGNPGRSAGIWWRTAETKSNTRRHNLTWYYDRVKLVEPAPLGKQRSRDAKDDPYLACALAAGAKIIVSRDDDLLALEKPFGIQIITPRLLLARLARLG